MMLAFYQTIVTKDEILAQLQLHAEADEIVKGQYWKNGKGCAVGCTIHSGDHSEYEPRFGIPQMLARLEDRIFEGLPDGNAKEWPLRFMRAVKQDSDLSLVGWQFLHWMLTDKTVNPGIEHELVRDAVRQCADVIAPLAKGRAPDESAAESAAAAAEWAARSAAEWAAAAAAERAAARSAERAAARSAESAAYQQMANRLIELIEAAPTP